MYRGEVDKNDITELRGLTYTKLKIQQQSQGTAVNILVNPKIDSMARNSIQPRPSIIMYL